MVVAEYGALAFYLVLAGAIVVGVYYGYRYVKPRLMISTFQSALTLGVIEDIAEKLEIGKERFTELVERIEKMDYKSKDRNVSEKIEMLIQDRIDEAFENEVKTGRMQKRGK